MTIKPYPYAAKAIIQHQFDTDHLDIYLTFRHPMNQDVKPLDSLWQCIVDDVQKPISVSAWQDTFTMLLTVPNISVYPWEVTLAYDGPSKLLTTTWNKQWEPWGAILSTDIGGAPVYVDRGDTSVYDYVKTDLTVDGNWNELDLSGIVPEKAKAVFIAGHLEGVSPSWKIRFRKNGNVNDIVHGGIETLRAGIERHRSSIVALDDDRKIEYNADNQNWTVLSLIVKGWWF